MKAQLPLEPEKMRPDVDRWNKNGVPPTNVAEHLK